MDDVQERQREWMSGQLTGKEWKMEGEGSDRGWIDNPLIDNPLMEIPLLLTREQLLALESAALHRGLSLGPFLRLLIRSGLKVIDPVSIKNTKMD